MRDRQFEYAQPGAGRPHLHLEVPAVGLVSHAQAHQHIAPDRPEWAHIGVTHAIKQAQRRADHSPGEKLVSGHAARLSFAADARADYEIAEALGDRLDKARDQLGAITAVAIEKHDDVAILGSLGAGPTGPAIAALAQAHDSGAGRSRAL